MNTAQGSVAPVQILAISDVYPPDLGEVAVSLRTLLREIQAKGHAVTLIAPECGANDDDRCDDVIRVSAHAVRLRARVARVMKVQRVLELTERLRGWNYDLVHVHTPGVAYIAGTALARRLRLPVVATCYALQEEALLRSFPVLRPAGARTVARLLARVYCRGLDGLVVRSYTLRERLETYGFPGPIAVAPAAVEVQLLQCGDGARFRAAHGISEERAVLLHAGDLADAAETDFLLAVLRRVREDMGDVMLVLAGEGVVPTPLRARVEALGLREHVLFASPIGRLDDMLDGYRAADCFVAAPRREKRNLRLLEALAAGLPAVTTRAAARCHALEEGGGVIMAADDVPHFAGQVRGVLTDPRIHAELSAEGMRQSQQWSASLAAEQVLDCYRQVLRERRSMARALAQ
ncbi:MAG TPA: glycosyltransferase [Burkholderiales bacterium]